MDIGHRLKAAMERRRVTQKYVATHARMGEGAVSKILSGKRKPTFEIVERMVTAIGVSWSELFNEPQVRLSADDAAILSRALPALREGADAVPVLVRILENDAAQKAIGRPAPEPPPPKRRRKSEDVGSLPRGSEIRDGAPIHHEVVPVPNGSFPEWALRAGATRPYTVDTDSMIGLGILKGSTIYVRPAVDYAAADGRVIVCTVNGSTYLKTLDLRGGGKVLRSENPRYPPLVVRDDDIFAMTGVVEGLQANFLV